MASELPNVTAALVALTEAGIPTDVQELLVRGDASRGIAPGAIIKALNTRPAPAATDTGMETFSVEKTSSGHPYMKSDPEGDYVTRSQAVELLAAERAAQQRLLDIIEEANEHKEALEADNAAKDARVKAHKQQKEAAVDNWKICAAQIEAIEAKLAAAEQAARAAHETLIEINPSNYNHDDVCQLNDASVEAIFLLADILGETHGKTKEWWDERRAVLGGKPS